MGCSHSTKQSSQIVKLTVTDELENEHTVTSLVILEDKRLASATNAISVYSYNVDTNQWTKDINNECDGYGTILCAMKGNRLLSCDSSIKVWTVSDVDMTLIKEIKEHKSTVNKVIPLSKERFASCSNDKTVKIWKDDNTYECITTIELIGNVSAILQLKGKEVLVSSSDNISSDEELTFWNLNNWTKIHTVEGYSAYCSTHIKELPNGDIAVVVKKEDIYFIVIIDTSSYEVKTEIYEDNYITYFSSLCVLNDHSFVYACQGNFLQISCEDYSIMYKSRRGNFNGYTDICLIEGGKFLAIENETCISIVEPCYV